MPDTARMRGLDDPFNPAEALFASAFYLAELARDFGNIGLAAVAYNGGEARAARFIGAKDGLPHETREYVHAITGYSAVAWRDAPPAKVDLALGGEADFQAACQAQAAARPAGVPVRAGAAVGCDRGLEPGPRRRRAPGRAAAEPLFRDPGRRAGQL
jgi:hypothetical protein